MRYSFDFCFNKTNFSWNKSFFSLLEISFCSESSWKKCSDNLIWFLFVGSVLRLDDCSIRLTFNNLEFINPHFLQRWLVVLQLQQRSFDSSVRLLHFSVGAFQKSENLILNSIPPPRPHINNSQCSSFVVLSFNIKNRCISLYYSCWSQFYYSSEAKYYVASSNRPLCWNDEWWWMEAGDWQVHVLQQRSGSMKDFLSCLQTRFYPLMKN